MENKYCDWKLNVGGGMCIDHVFCDWMLDLVGQEWAVFDGSMSWENVAIGWRHVACCISDCLSGW